MLNVTDEMLFAAVKKAVEVELLPCSCLGTDIEIYKALMRPVLQEALKAYLATFCYVREV